jgi:two-component system, LytTR family, sensor kinase
MINPFTKNRKYLYIYLFVWLLIILIQATVLNYYQDIDLLASLTDSAVFNIILAIIGFNLWYVLRFSVRENLSTPDMIINHLLTAAFMIGLWLASGYFIVAALESKQEDYLAFLNSSLPWRAIIGVFFYLVFILLYYISLYYEDLQQKLKIESRLNNLVKEAELNALKAQINPHFLFNSLNSISSLTMTNPEKAQEMVIKLSDFLRYSLSHNRNEKTSLKNELENTERYLDIEKVRFGKRLRYVSNVVEACYEVQIPNMILQPLFENAIKHGVYNSVEEVLVELNCGMKDGYLHIRLTNDFDPEALRPKGEGIGLQNIRSRLQLIYQRNDLFEVNMGKIEFEAILKIPIFNNHEQ